MTKEEHAKAVDFAVFPGLQGGPHNHTTAAIAVALKEASQPEFKAYAHQIVANAKALAAGLIERGFDLVSGGTDNHLILIDLTNKGVFGKPAAKALDRAGIELNYNTVPNDPRKPFDPSGIRLGTPSVTTRGMKEAEMALIAAWIDQVVGSAGRRGPGEEGLGGDQGAVRRLPGAGDGGLEGRYRSGDLRGCLQDLLVGGDESCRTLLSEGDVTGVVGSETPGSPEGNGAQVGLPNGKTQLRQGPRQLQQRILAPQPPPPGCIHDLQKRQRGNDCDQLPCAVS